MRRILTVILSVISLLSFAQEDSDCSKTLKKAQQVYDAGEIEKVEPMLISCLEDGFNNAEKTNALELIILVHLFEDDISSAEINMVELLKHNPDYRPKSNAHQEIKDLFSKFRTDPLLIVDYTVGVNFSEASVLKYYTLDNTSPYSKDYYTRIGAEVSAVGNYLIKNNFRVNVGANYSLQNFGIYDLYGISSTDYDTEPYQIIDASVNTSQLGVQLGGLKEFGRRKLMPFLGIGSKLSFLLSSNHTIRRSYVNNVESIGDVTGESLESLANLNENNISVFMELGFRYKIGLLGKLLFSVKPSYGLINQTFQANRYANSEMVYKYYFIPDDFLLHNMSINIGYSQLIYKPKKTK